MSKASRTARRRARSTRDIGHPSATRVSCAAPLVRLQAHWTMQAHPRYLEAANFMWTQ